MCSAPNVTTSESRSPREWAASDIIADEPLIAPAPAFTPTRQKFDRDPIKVTFEPLSDIHEGVMETEGWSLTLGRRVLLSLMSPCLDFRGPGRLLIGREFVHHKGASAYVRQSVRGR